jgi:hypothetical protein
MSIDLDDTVATHSRVTYDLFALLSDVGGLLVMLYVLVGVFAAPYAKHEMKFGLITDLFKIKTSKDDGKKVQISAFQSLGMFLNRMCFSSKVAYTKFFERGEIILQRQLDISSMIKRNRHFKALLN